MTRPDQRNTSRREFLQQSGRIAAATAISTMVVPAVHAADDSTVQVALVGCGGRGTGAAANCLSVEQQGVIKLTAMADVFEHRLAGSHNALAGRYSERMDVPNDRKFIGFDAYQKAIDTLRPGDVAIFATPPAFRWVHFKYAIEKGVNVFMEKPVTVDGGSSKRMFELAEQASAKNIKVAVGLMCRHCEARQELFDRIQNDEIGDVNMLRAYRMTPPIGSAFSTPKPADKNELMWQIERFHSFLWASGGCYSDFLIHNIDECCWMKNDWPVRAQAVGGRHYRGDNIDQNFDHYSVEYTFGDGTKLLLDGRNIAGCHDEFASYAHGSKGLAVISTSAHSPAKCRTYAGHNEDKAKQLWAFPQPEQSPYQLEWNHLIEAIRRDQPYNEVKRGVEASLVTAMGRMAAHTGRVITREEALNAPEFAPDVDKLVLDGPAPIQADSDGKYPVPMPGFVKDREYAG